MSLGVVSAHQELRPGRCGGFLREEGAVWIQHNTRHRSRQVLRECARRNNEAAMRSLARACSRSNWPQVPRTRGTDGAAQVAAARRSAGEHRTATVLDYRLRLYTEVSTLCCRVTRAIWGETFEKQGVGRGRDTVQRSVWSVWSGSARPPSRSGGNRDDEDGTSRGYSTNAPTQSSLSST